MIAAARKPGQMDPVERHLTMRLKKLRRNRGLAQAEIDALAGLPLGTCKRLENGIAFFGPSQLYALARSLDIDPSCFFDGLPPQQQPTAQDIGTVPDNGLTEEARDLVTAFHHIEDSLMRKRIMGLIRAVAD